MEQSTRPHVVEFRCGLFRELSLLAVLDYDSTLRRNETILAWLAYLRDHEGWKDADGMLQHIETLIDDYNRGGRTRDELSTAYSRSYAGFMRDRSVVNTAALARRFVCDGAGGGLWGYPPPLMSGLRELNVVPVVISGAPSEITTAHLRPLGIARIFALELEERDGKYTGRIRAHHGESSQKRAAVRSLITELCGAAVVVLGAGDSESDNPLLEDAYVRLEIGGHIGGLSAWAGAETITFSGQEADDPSSARRVLAALRELLAGTGLCSARFRDGCRY